MTAPDLNRALVRLFRELTEGAPPGGGAYMLNSGDIGLLRSLDGLSAAEASTSMQGGASIAAHARHLQYGLSLMNRWARDGGNPFADAQWDEAWKVREVDEAEWASIRASLAAEVVQWKEVLGAPRELDPVALTGMISSIAHLAYHFGAMRQVAVRARGPREGTFT